MSLNSKILSIYSGNINEDGKRISKWTWLADKHGVSKVALSRVSSIRKRCTDEEFEVFSECMKGNETVLISNGTSSHNISHIAVLLLDGHKVVGKGKTATTTNVRHDRSCVYVLSSSSYYKIGVTLDTSISRRIQQLQIGNPYSIDLVASTGTIKNAYEVEKTLHDTYKSNKIRGEWLELNSDELKHVIEEIGRQTK